jgi:hypothetical protein
MKRLTVILKTFFAVDTFYPWRLFSKYAVTIAGWVIIDNTLGCLRLDAWPLP